MWTRSEHAAGEADARVMSEEQLLWECREHGISAVECYDDLGAWDGEIFAETFFRWLGY